MENKEFATDFVELVNSLRGLSKTRQVDYSSRGTRTKYDYTPLDDMLDACKAFKKIAITFKIKQKFKKNGDLVLGVRVRAVHISGAEDISEPVCRLIAAEEREQSNGSKITYLKRYALAGYLGISCDADTDATDQEPRVIGEPKPLPQQQQPEIVADAMTEETKERLGQLSAQLIDLLAFKDKNDVFMYINNMLGHRMSSTETDGQAAIEILTHHLEVMYS